MTRIIVFLVGLGATTYGVWIIASDNSRNTACNASHPTVGGLSSSIGMGSGCLNIVWVYFLGFALLAFGLLAMVVAMSMMRKLRKRRGKYVEKARSPHAGKPS
jgi:phage shock protein PspC (stress-responsive transcriptional regulator)